MLGSVLRQPSRNTAARSPQPTRLRWCSRPTLCDLLEYLELCIAQEQEFTPNGCEADQHTTFLPVS